MKSKEVAAMRISSQIHAIEDEIDALLGRAGGLLADMAEYRIETDMDANLGQRPLARVTEMQGKLIEARTKAIGAHSDLKKIIEKADFPFDCPDPVGTLRDAKATHLKVA